MGKRIC